MRARERWQRARELLILYFVAALVLLFVTYVLAPWIDRMVHWAIPPRDRQSAQQTLEVGASRQ